MIPDGNPCRHEEFTALTIRFVGEQDGPPERELKSHLTTLLKDEPSVQRAYLARVQYENAAAPDVALCLAATTPDADRIKQRVGRLFAGIFRPDAYLDVFFLSDSQEADAVKVCRPFYSKSEQ